MVLLSCLRRQLKTKIGATGYYYLWAIVPLQLLLSIFATKLSFENKIVSQSHVFYFSSNIDWTRQVIENTSVFPVYLWAIGCASLVLFVAWQYAFNRINVTHSRELTENDFSLDECGEHSNLWPKIYLSKSTATPVAYGFIHPVIVVPVRFLQLTNKQQQLVIQHELVHLRRGDLYWNLLALATVAVFRFNPLAWLGYRQFRLAQEMSCDAQVLVNEAMVTRQSYAKAFLAHTVSSETELLTTLYYGGKKNMKERLSNIKNGTHKNWKRIPVALAFLSLSAVFQTLAMSENPYDRSDVQPIKRMNPSYPIYAAKMVWKERLFSVSVLAQTGVCQTLR